MDAFWQYQLEVLNLLRDFINSEKIRIDLVYDKINDIEFLYLKNSVISELWIRDFLPHIINGNLEYLITGLFKKIPNLSNEEYNRLLANGVVLICIGKDNYAAYLSFPPKRTPTDSLCDPSNLFGARDGFNEVIADNRILIRKRIKSSNLLFEEIFLGNMTSTEINIAYLKKNEKLVAMCGTWSGKNGNMSVRQTHDSTGLWDQWDGNFTDSMTLKCILNDDGTFTLKGKAKYYVYLNYSSLSTNLKTLEMSEDFTVTGKSIPASICIKIS